MVCDQERLERLLPIMPRLPNLQLIVVRKPPDPDPDPDPNSNPNPNPTPDSDPKARPTKALPKGIPATALTALFKG